jgi:enoyl-CoA hydratase/carnithine racemase
MHRLISQRHRNTTMNMPERLPLQSPVILVERTGRVGIVTLNRPGQLNALNDEVMDGLGQALLELDGDDGIGAIVITGGPKAFAAGAEKPARVAARAKASSISRSSATTRETSP